VSERREYFRVRALARVSLRALGKSEAESLRCALYTRAGAPSPARFATEGAREEFAGELRALLESQRQTALALERIERRLERLERGGGEGTAAAVEISLSGAGFAGPFELELEPDQLAWAELELPGSALAPITALVRSVGSTTGEFAAAFHFEDIHPEDREQIVQLALRIQSQRLRAEREAGR